MCRSELFSYETCIFYTVLTSLPTLDRVSLKSKVVNAPEILTVIESIPHLSTYLNALYKCQYADFVKVSQLLRWALCFCRKFPDIQESLGLCGSSQGVCRVWPCSLSTKQLSCK